MSKASETPESTMQISPIAIIGMSVRIPGASDVETFWTQLKEGKESIRFFTDDELREAGVSESLIQDPTYVKAMGSLEDVDLFDASFFGLIPREAEILDPQHRILMETVWKGLEHASIDPQRFDGRIGLFAGVGLNSYLLHHLLPNQDVIESVGGWQLNLSNDKDFAATRIAYTLNLQGPAISLNTACSTSLVAVAMGAQSLQSYQSDVVIAGGCSIHLPQDQGYQAIQGGTLSTDGHCRPFDRHASGTIDGNGAAVVILKRLEDAIADRDTIHAVIKGYAINNDGSGKVGYTAPGVDGQSEVVLEAMEMAGCTGEEIDFIETHGTATQLGDTIEIAALTNVFRQTTNRVGDVFLGSLKSNVGHLDTAAGVGGLIKAVLSMQYGTIPPMCHFTSANPKLDLETSPFCVPSTATPWPVKQDKPKMAGISAFGIGGTNAHVIIEEPPVAESFPVEVTNPKAFLLPFSAKTSTALQRYIKDVAAWLKEHSDVSLADIAFTLQNGRAHFEFRMAVIVENGKDGITQLIRQLSELSEKDIYGDTVVHQDPIGADISNPGLDIHALKIWMKEWLKGADLPWEQLNAPGRRIPFPGHPLDRKRYWISPPQLMDSTGVDPQSTNENTLSDPSAPLAKLKNRDHWFYLPGVKRTSLAPLSHPPETKMKRRWILSAEASDGAIMVLSGIYDHLKRAGDECRILLAEEQRSLADNSGSFDSADIHFVNLRHLDTLKSKFQESEFFGTTHVVHLVQGSEIDSEQDRPLPNSRLPVHFERELILTSAVGSVFGQQEVVYTQLIIPEADMDILSELPPDVASSLGPVRVLPQEYPNVSSRSVILSTTEFTRSKERLLSVLHQSEISGLIVLKKGQLWTEAYEKTAIPLPEKLPVRLRREGVYLLTGGLGNIGFTISKYLAKQCKAHLILTGRSPNPDLTPLKALQKEASSAEYVAVDVSDLTSMQDLIQRIVAKHGKIDGIIHAAGLVGEETFLTLHDSHTHSAVNSMEGQFLPKQAGTRVISACLEEVKFDFCLVCSSLSPMLGGLGFSAYAASNLYVDALVEQLNRKQPGKWLGVNWEGWVFDDDAIPESMGASGAFELGMSAEEGLEAFIRIMNRTDLDRIVVSSADLSKRLDQWVHRMKHPAKDNDLKPQKTHSRPAYLGETSAPETATEEKLLAIWEELLGMHGIGTDDSFFELGGNSLLLTQMVAHIRRSFQAELSLAALFHTPTIQAISAQIDQVITVSDSTEREEGIL